MAVTPEERPDPNTVPMDQVGADMKFTPGPITDPETYTVNVPGQAAQMQFIRAQGAYIRAMSYFMDEGRHVGDDKEYINHITGYATAQGLFIAAQQNFLKALGAL